jgi:hypothetical protein
LRIKSLCLLITGNNVKGAGMNIFQRVIIEPFESFFEKVLNFLPNFLTSLLILLVGIILGKILKVVFLRLFQAISLDKFADRYGVIELMKKGGIKDPVSILLSKLIGGIVIFMFAIISMRALEITTVELLFERFLLYLPNIFVAAVILLFGYLFGNFFGRAALIASVNAGVRVSGFVGRFVKFTVFMLSVTMALEQLGIGRETVLIAFSVIFGGIVLEVIEKKIRGEEKNDEISHL